MRVLFFMRSTVYVRNFESTLRMLAERGHEVHVVADAHHHLDHADLMSRLAMEYPGITHGEPPAPSARRWGQLGYELRRGLDYLRYLEPEYRDAPKLRRRAEQKMPVFVASAIGRRLAASDGGRRALRRILHAADRAVPRDPAIDEFVRAHRPHLVLVTPLVEPGSPQSQYIRSARALGLRTGLCVYSWDNLTNKGLIHDALDVVTVWNQPMKDEAVGLHGVPADHVVVTGAAAYDHWFAWQPRFTREAFCERVSLDARRPYLLYLCSSKFIAPDELPFVRRWIATIRSSSAELRDIGILVRPHPQNVEPWRAADLSDLGNVAVWPRAKGNPVDAESRADYFDSIHHSAAVVGVNTSAQIESAIVGRGVYTLLAPEFRETQEGTLHFRHLRDVNGGLLHVASDFPEHVAQLEAAVRHPAAAAERCRRFLEVFVRPYGLTEPATPRLVAALEATAALGPAPRDRTRLWTVPARPALFGAAVALERAEQGREQRESRKKRPREERTPTVPARRAETTKADAAGLAQTAYRHYQCVREQVRRLQLADAPDQLLTAAELQMRSALAPLWGADADVIANLRGHCKAISGVRRSAYRPPHVEVVQARLRRDLQRLLDKGNDALLIDEPVALGGFGVEALGRTVNEETLQFFRVLSLLQDAAVLRAFRGAAPRRTVWEIGGGWGGFAYQFKRLHPNVTYLMTGMPDLFLVSAVYLMTLFPAARFRFYDPARPAAFWEGWHEVDFAFAPESVVETMRPPAVDLLLDLETLQRMTPARLDLHVRRAHDLGVRHLLSIHGADAVSIVRPAVERAYWPHPVSGPAYLDRRLAVRGRKQFLLGSKRLHALAPSAVEG